jgi:radical SAM superfamily enzyme YgiQ (UPF0313 family)
MYGHGVKTVFFPAGNTIAMPTEELAEICRYTRELFPALKRITVYGSSMYIAQKGLEGLNTLRNSGLTRIHVGLESGDDETLRRIKKGTTAEEQIQAGLWVREAGLELSEYVVLGAGGKGRSLEHALETAKVLNAINPHFIRLRTLLPKVNTLLLHQIKKGRFQLLSPHQVLLETRKIIENLEVKSSILSDHYTNYVDIQGTLPQDRANILETIEKALQKKESSFRPVYVGTQ